MQFLGDAASSVAAYSEAWAVDGIVGATIVAHVSRVVQMALYARVSVPSVVTVQPGQIWGGAGHQEVQGPSYDDVVVEGHVERNQNRAETNACERRSRGCILNVYERLKLPNFCHPTPIGATKLHSFKMMALLSFVTYGSSNPESLNP